jgi:pimeloyl-ACP methyl ester carboxylesterase
LHAYDELRHRLPDCTPVLLPGGEHFSPLEQPELLLEHLTGFLGRETRAVEEKSA